MRKRIALFLLSGSALIATASFAGATVSTSTSHAITRAASTTSAAGACDAAAYPSLQWTQCEAENLAVSLENPTDHASLTAGIVAATLAYQQARTALLFTDPERQPNPNTCTTAVLCPIDPRVLGWANGSGIVAPVLYTSRSGATMAGNVWATRSGPAKRPGIVIINGSIVGFEPIYRYAAQALAKAGFVVLTFDAQGEGMSDQFGQSPDQNEDAFAGTPGLGFLGPTPAAGPGLGGNGLAFYDGGEDALNFFLSTPSSPYVPVPSRSTGTSHEAKQARRVLEGFNNAYNPLWSLLDRSRIGLAGHSYGAVAVAYLAQQDPRVTTAVAWDDLCIPVSPSPDEVTDFATAPVNTLGGILPVPFLYGFGIPCFGAPAGPAPAITKPELSLTSDYLLEPNAYVAPPPPNDKGPASLSYSQLGLDAGSIVIRGGTHFEFNDAPIVLPATLRGIDMVTWYTTAWFSKYLLHVPRGDAMLLTSRWRDDAAAGAADPAGDANVYSWHYNSRMDIRLSNGKRFDCEALRAGCAGQTNASNDGGPANYSFVAVDTAPDGP
jgi:dienelactone hydrolase